MAPRPITQNTPQTFYSDFTDNMDIHPDLGDLFKITNANAVKRSLRNIVLTNKYERPFNPDFGCNIRAMLFENLASPDIQNMVIDVVTNAITKFEPRVANLKVTCQAYPNQNGLVINVSFSILNIAGSQSLSIPIVQRVR